MYGPTKESPNRMTIRTQSEVIWPRVHIKADQKISGVAKHSTVIDHITPLMSLRIINALSRTLRGSKLVRYPT